MEAERKREKNERQVTEKRTAFNLREEKRKAAEEARESSPALMALYNLFMPGARNRGNPKFITDKWGNRVRAVTEAKKVKNPPKTKKRVKKVENEG